LDNKIKGLIIIVIILIGAVGVTSAMLLQKNNVTSNITANNTTSNGTNNSTSTPTTTKNANSVKNLQKNGTTSNNNTSVGITPKISASQAEQIVLEEDTGIHDDATLSASYDSTTGIYTITISDGGYSLINGTSGAVVGQGLGTGL
jgi:cytoskeletal protein RodZ